MKRGFLIFVVLFVFTVGAWAQCAQDPNDRGLPDTMYVEPWPDDIIWTGSAGPYFVRVPIYVTNDVVDAWDSIPAFVIPLCYNHSNPSKYCSLSAYWNNVTLYPNPDLDRSIFRHFIEGQDTLIHNRMMDLSQQMPPGLAEWDTRILDLGGEVARFWFCTIASGSQDKRWWEASRVLFATMTFRLEDSMMICIDTCFWPPSNRLAWVTKPAGGGYPITKIPRIWDDYLGVEEVCFSFEPPDPVDCYRSFSDPCLVACPLGDIPFKVHLRTSAGGPVPNYSNVWLDYSGCSGIIPCPSETSWPIVHPDGPSDADGVMTFHVHAGGCDNLHYAQVKAGCGLVGYVPVKTVDTDGDLVVEVNDWHGIPDADPCNDYNCNGIVNSWDVDFFERHVFHSCDPDSCLLVSRDLTVTPDTLLPVDSTHRVRLFIQNNNAVPCSLLFVKFYRTGFGEGATPVQFATNYLLPKLMPGDTVSTEADFVVPGPGSGDILTKLETDCCDQSLDNIFSFRVRMCPPDSMVYVFPLLMDVVPAYVETLDYMPDMPGWYWFIYETGSIPDSVAIVTPDQSVLGVTGGITLYFFDLNWNLLHHRTCEVRITLNSGDLNSDCIVDLGDILSLVSYLYKGGPEPDPYRAGDVNCDCLLDLGDILYLVSYLYKGGPPPASSETCECGYKEWFPY